MGDQDKKEVERRPRILIFMNNLSFKRIFFFWILSMMVFGLLYFAAGESKDPASLKSSAYSAFLISITGKGMSEMPKDFPFDMLVTLQVLASLLIYALVISRFMGVKQDVTLEEVKNIGFEETLDKLRSGLYLFRSDVARMIEKIESETLKARELRDIWIIFSGLDTSITSIKDFIIPRKTDEKHRKIDIFKFELLLNSIKLSMNKTLELVKALKNHHYDWRNELMLTSIYYDVRVVQDIINYSAKRNEDKKVLDRLNELKILINYIDEELKVESREAEEKPGSQAVRERQDGSSPQPKTDWIGELKHEANNDPNHHNSDGKHDSQQKEHHPEENQGISNQSVSVDVAPANSAGEGAGEDVRR